MRLRILILILSAGLAQAAGFGPALDSASIEGVVVQTGAADVTIQFPDLDKGKTNVAAGVGEPLTGATVELTAVEGGRVRSYIAKTGRDGKFQFRNLRAGPAYQLVAILHPDYLPGQYGQSFPISPGMPVSLSSHQAMKDLRIALTPAASISGRVLSPAGLDVRAWRVSLVRPLYVDGQRVLGAVPFGASGVVATALTDDAGNYQFKGLPPGEYYILDEAGSFYARPGLARPSDVHLRPGENLKDIDVAVPLTTIGINGRIVDVNGRRIDSAEIAVMREDGASAATPPHFRKTQGSFTTTAPSAGRYLLLVKANEHGTPLFGHARVHVGESDISDLQIVAAPPSDISGLVTGGVAGGRQTVRLHPLLPGMVNSPIIGVSPGFIAVGVGAGEYRVDVSAAPDADYIQSIRFGSEEAADGIIHVSGQSNQPLEIVLGARGGIVDGRALNDRGEPAMSARAVLVPKRRLRVDLYKNGFTDQQGRFQLRGIAPGDYKLFVWEFAQDDAWLDPNFLALYEHSGKPVRIEEGERISAKVPAISPWR